ncbi:MAG TPA: hypothetical protein VM142_15170 [Acidimicrobiales bacterium]|nr:hypothetical protein [Acidimicrobiales bacterium]
MLRSLVASGRFHLDTGFGRMFHPGKISLRENVPTNSLHILVDDNRVSAHVDLVSPLGLRPRPSSRYATGRIAAHNLSGMAADVVRLLRGRQGDHRCELACEWYRQGGEGAKIGGAGIGPGGVDGYSGGSTSVQFEARVGGRVDDKRLAVALAAALCTHPDALRVVDCADDKELASIREEFQGSMVPLQECPPLRVLLAHHAVGDILMLNVNHAASDGFGALRILQALARAFVSDGLDLPHLEFLALRDLPVGPASGRVSAVKKWYLNVIERLRNALAPPARLVAEGAAGEPPPPNSATETAPGRRLGPQVQPFADPNDDPRYGFHLITLPLTDHGGGLSLAPPAIETDVLIAALHRAIGAWNAAHGYPGHRISILMPSDLRPSGWPDELVGNFSVTARVSTSRRHRGSLAAALKAVGSQTRRNNRSRTGIALISALDRSGLLPLWTRQSRIVLEPITRNRFVDTALLCDLGRIADPPSFGPEAGRTNEVWFSAPARVPVPLSIGAATLGGRLHLSMRYSRSLFGPEAAARFAEYYLVELDPTRPAPPPVAS